MKILWKDVQPLHNLPSHDRPNLFGVD